MKSAWPVWGPDGKAVGEIRNGPFAARAYSVNPDMPVREFPTTQEAERWLRQCVTAATPPPDPIQEAADRLGETVRAMAGGSDPVESRDGHEVTGLCPNGEIVTVRRCGKTNLWAWTCQCGVIDQTTKLSPYQEADRRRKTGLSPIEITRRNRQ